ncbi:Lon protease mitochondrial, partial [Fasciola gigantica]
PLAFFRLLSVLQLLLVKVDRCEDVTAPQLILPLAQHQMELGQLLTVHPNHNWLCPRKRAGHFPLITDERLITLLRRKIKLNTPYAGVFLKRSSSDPSDVVSSVDDLYRIGTFVQIPEWDDLGAKLRLLVIGHRRIQLVRQVDENTAFVSDVPPGLVPRK